MKSLINPADRAEVFQRLEHVGAESPGLWGGMSAHQMICHLSDSFRMGLGDRPLGDKSTLLTRTIIKWLALYTSRPWPRNVEGPPEIDQLLGGTSPAEFTQDFAELKRLVGRFCEGEPKGRNAVFGPLTHRQWMRWAYLHLDHHLRQFGA